MSDEVVADAVMLRYAGQLRSLADAIEAGTVSDPGPETMLCMTLDNIVRKCSDCSYRYTCVKSAVFGVVGGIPGDVQDMLVEAGMKLAKWFSGMEPEQRYNMFRMVLEFFSINCDNVEEIMGGVFRDCIEYGHEDYWFEVGVIPSGRCTGEWVTEPGRNEKCLKFVPPESCLDCGDTCPMKRPLEDGVE